MLTKTITVQLSVDELIEELINKTGTWGEEFSLNVPFLYQANESIYELTLRKVD